MNVNKFLMRSIKILKIILIGCLLLGFSVYAQNNGATNKTSKVKNLFFCPSIKSIKKDPKKLTWSAPGGWQSYEISFVNKLTKFYGAQWTGTKVGQITCLYQGDTPSSFPVLLVFDTLTYQPSGGKWSKDLGGYQNCVARKRANCPFKIRVKPPEKDIYQEAEQLKSNNNNDQSVE